MIEMAQALATWVGFFHIFFVLLGFADLLHYRLYIGIEDKVIVSKAEYEELRTFREHMNK